MVAPSRAIASSSSKRGPRMSSRNTVGNAATCACHTSRDDELGQARARWPWGGNVTLGWFGHGGLGR
eukprot:139899-Prymnesium_polylepis.1